MKYHQHFSHAFPCGVVVTNWPGKQDVLSLILETAYFSFSFFLVSFLIFPFLEIIVVLFCFLFSFPCNTFLPFLNLLLAIISLSSAARRPAIEVLLVYDKFF